MENLELDLEDVCKTITCEIGPDGVVFPKADLKLDNQGVSKLSTGEMQTQGQIDPSQFKLGSFIGKGACGYVQQAIYQPNNTPVALKTVNLYDRDKRHQMLNDLKICLGNNHQSDNLIRFYGAFYHEGMIKIILELMDLGSLRDLIDILKEQIAFYPLDERFLKYITTQILQGLFYLHHKNHQVHRDIKPENILINSMGNIKLTDFGISKELEKTKSVTNTFVGTISYMSPERIQGMQYSYSSDIWSVGIVLVELAIGKYPVEAFNSERQMTYLERIQSMIQSNPPSLPKEFNYSSDFHDFISCMLVKDPYKRCSVEQLLVIHIVQIYQQHRWLNQCQSEQYNQQTIAQILTQIYSNYFQQKQQ